MKKHQLETLLNSLAEPVIRWSPDGQPPWVNTAYWRYAGGLAPVTHAASDGLVSVLNEDLVRLSTAAGLLTPDRPSSTREQRTILADGREVWHEWVDQGLFSEDGRLLQVYAVGREITASRGDRELARRTLSEVLCHCEDERAALSRELHEEVAQELSAVLLRTRLLHESIGDDDGSEPARQLSQISDLTSNAIARLVELAHRLRPVMLDDLGLEATLSWLCTTLEQQTGTPIDFRLGGSLAARLDRGREALLYRVTETVLGRLVQEPGIDGASLFLAYTSRRVVLRITAESTEHSALPSLRSLGLRPVQQLLDLLGGTLVLEAEHVEGPAITLVLPLRGSRGHRGTLESRNDEQRALGSVVEARCAS